MTYIEPPKSKDISVLSKRMRFLEERIASTNKDLTYDKQEAASLRRVVNLLDLLERKPWLIKELYGKDRNF